MTFVPGANWNGTTPFTRQGHDGTEWSSNTATMTMSVTAVNDTPTVNNFAKSVNEDVLLTFSAADFTSNFSDIDGDSLTQIRITGLPSHGVLKNGSTTLAVNDTVPVAQLGNINYQGASNNNTAVTFTRQGYDGTAYSTNSTVSITIVAVNDEPTISDVTDQSTNEDVALNNVSFTIGDIDSTLTCASSVSKASSNTTLLPVGNITI